MFRVLTTKKCVNCGYWQAKPIPQRQERHVCKVSGKSTNPNQYACDYWIKRPNTLEEARRMDQNVPQRR